MKKASALAYSPDMPAPRIIASGQGREAEQIIAIAREAGITVVEDPGLEALLNAGKTGDYIPEWCWDTVAKILAFVIAKEKR
ncbi:EscU/YscU/HrcU family type III secretion system export apparatus switch protein [Treponema primitia]|uniref:EscU/YscU/HrcU family type III secretion system export apparatus switch protein n=1 Tax=Treponema primitia TaxID=88058 RepID=UPI00025555AA|nr:EscU/YscU/HrcU family type III secretion system export apparatus switch protein [Treponema primitia]